MKKVFAILLVIGLLVGVFVLTGCDDSQVENQPSQTDGNQEETDKPAEESVNTNSRQNPAGLNEVFTVNKDDWWSGKVTYEVEMIDMVSGKEAWNIVKKANQFNDEPKEGMEYVLAKFRFKIIDTEEDEPYSLLWDTSFSVISGTGVEYSELVFVSGLEPSLDQDLYEGAEHEGWTAFMINEGDNAVVALDRRTNAEIWFSLKDNQ